MNTNIAIVTGIIVVVSIIAVTMEITAAVYSYRYGVKYSPIVINLYNVIKHYHDPEGYVKYAYAQIVNPDKYFGRIKSNIIKAGGDPKYADGIISISREVMERYNK